MSKKPVICETDSETHSDPPENNRKCEILPRKIKEPQDCEGVEDGYTYYCWPLHFQWFGRVELNDVFHFYLIWNASGIRWRHRISKSKSEL